MKRTREALLRIAAADTELAARLIVQMLPSATRADDGSFAIADAELEATTDAAGVVALFTGETPVALMLKGRVRVRGKRRKIGSLRALAEPRAFAIAEPIDADALHRGLPYAIDPAWTTGHSFRVAWLVGDGPGWLVQACDGGPLRVTLAADPGASADATVRVDAEVHRQIVSGALTTADAVAQGIAEVSGQLAPVLTLGRWVERLRGGDDAELAREERQRLIQVSRAFEDPEIARAERERWSASEVDLTADARQWLAIPAAVQAELVRSLGPVVAGAELLTAGLGSLIAAAPSGEAEVIIAHQIADLARERVLLDRFAAEVLALEPGDLRGRSAALRGEADDSRRVAWRAATEPEELDSWVDGVLAWHVVAGWAANAARRELREQLQSRSLFPGFAGGLARAERDGARHAAFGERVVGDALRRGSSAAEVLERRAAELAAGAPDPLLALAPAPVG